MSKSTRGDQSELGYGRRQTYRSTPAFAKERAWGGDANIVISKPAYGCHSRSRSGGRTSGSERVGGGMGGFVTREWSLRMDGGEEVVDLRVGEEGKR